MQIKRFTTTTTSPWDARSVFWLLRTSGSLWFLAWKMATCEIPVRYEMSRTSSVVGDCIIWRKCQSVTCVDAKFRFVRYLNTLRGMTGYKAPLANRSRSSHSRFSISLKPLIVDKNQLHGPGHLHLETGRRLSKLQTR